MPKCLPWRCAEVPRSLFEPSIKPVEDRKHDQKAKWQGPGEMSAKARSEEPHCRGPALDAALDGEIVEQPEFECDAKRGNDRWHDQARDGDIEQEARAAERFPEGHAGRYRNDDRQHHDDKAEPQRPLEGRPDVDDARPGKYLAEPHQGNAVHRKGKAAASSLEREDV